VLNTLGVKTVIASLFDYDKVAELAANSNVVLNIADSDSVEAVKAILRGLKLRHDKTGEVPIFIHTSGTGVFMDDAAGLHDTDVVYADTNAKQIEGLPVTALHRPVDLEVVTGDKEGYVRTYIVLPPTIYGIGTGKFYDLGISNPHSIQIPLAIRKSLDRGQGGVIGEGKNIWPHVELNELTEFYILLIDATLSDPSTAHGREGYYIIENGEYRLYDIAKEYSRALYDLGKGKSPDPTPFTPDEVQKYFGGPWLGSNSRVNSERSRKLGWKPTKTIKDFLESIRPEVEAIVAGK
jgi:nucleoside-diphosphate-sugar epimerase